MENLTGTIRGTVADKDGGALPGATVTATNQAAEFSGTAITDASGAYEFSALRPSDHYQVTFELDDFQTEVKKNVSVNEGQTTTLNVTMQVAKCPNPKCKRGRLVLQEGSRYVLQKDGRHVRQEGPSTLLEEVLICNHCGYEIKRTSGLGQAITITTAIGVGVTIFKILYDLLKDTRG